MILAAITRTLVPLVVGWIVTALVALGIDVSDADQATIAAAVGTVAGLGYYAAVKWAERRWPWASMLLGSTQQPSGYSADGKAPAGKPDAPDPFVKGL